MRDADELHDAFFSLVTLGEEERPDWCRWFENLVAAGRATTFRGPAGRVFWIAAECWPLVAAIFDEARAEPPVTLRAPFASGMESHGRLDRIGPRPRTTRRARHRR